MFSTNESIEDIPTGDLKYLLLEAHVSDTLLRQPFGSPESRLGCLRSSLRAGHVFLDRMRALDLVTEEEVQMIADNPLSRASGAQARQSKIARFKQEKALQLRMDVGFSFSLCLAWPLALIFYL
jgi:hypothetical protein